MKYTQRSQNSSNDACRHGQNNTHNIIGVDFWPYFGNFGPDKYFTSLKQLINYSSTFHKESRNNSQLLTDSKQLSTGGPRCSVHNIYLWVVVLIVFATHRLNHPRARCNDK